MDPSYSTDAQESSDTIEDKLFVAVMKNSWNEVVETYRNSPQTWKAKLTKSNDTALHIAVSNDKTSWALEMLEIIKDDGEVWKSMLNTKGNSPLHIAAMFGNMEVCKKITAGFRQRDHLTRHNKNGESPIFLAALHGNEDVFWHLHDLINLASSEEVMRSLRRDNGDNVLHVAISGEYFCMASRIIDKHKYLVDMNNMDGLSPLHILASKPNAFRSSTQLGLFNRFIYYCVSVTDVELRDKSVVKQKNRFGGPDQHDKNLNYPRNYKTCMNFASLLRFSFQMLGKGICLSSTDEENQQKRCAEKLGNTAGEPLQDTKKSLAETKLLSAGLGQGDKSWGSKRSFPPNYVTMVLFFKFLMKSFLIILGIGISSVREVEKMKILHIQGSHLLKKMVNCTTSYKSKNYGNLGSTPTDIDTEIFDVRHDEEDIKKTSAAESLEETEKNKKGGDEKKKKRKDETPMLIAARTGVTEMVELILNEFPVAIQDVDADDKNVVLVAVESRQPHVYQFLLDLDNIPRDKVFRHVDREGNSAPHLAATLCPKFPPWLISSSALQMQWEVKWFQFVDNSMQTPNYFPRYNKKNQSALEVFETTHVKLMQDGREWLTKTSESCSTMAALVAAVSFATSTTVPGGLLQDKGTPVLGHKPAFHIFAIASLVALCFSVTTLLIFFSILNSRYQAKDFALDLPLKLHLGLTSLFVSIASMLVSFCAGHIFVINREFRAVAYPLYVALCLPVTYFASAQLNLYIEHFISIFLKVPRRRYIY